MVEKNNKKFATYTLGCKVNQYETTAIEELFNNKGYIQVDFEEVADIYIINTCTVTSMSEKKCRQVIRRCKKKNNNAIVVVAGCYSQKEPEQVKNIDGVNLVIGTNNRYLILNEVEKIKPDEKKIVVDNIMLVKDFEKMKVTNASKRARAYIKVQDGCDRYCTYCIIPYTRGHIRSRTIEDSLSEVKELVKNGYQEIVLTGIHIGSYGKDLKTVSLIDLIKEISNVEGLKRLRTSSMEPITITEEFMQEIKNNEKFCPHFHLSLQSGSDSVLKRMNRRYTTEEYKKAVERIRKIFPEAAITTDVIVGFPGETDEEFNETYKFLQEINLYEMHIFKYSPREGTPAAKMDNQINASIKHQRSEKLIELSQKNKIEFNKKYIGKTVEVLFENKHDEYWNGHTKNYINVKCKNANNLNNKLVNVKIIDNKDDYLIGEII